MEQQAAARHNARNRQDRKHPFLINIEDGRLVPNVPMLGGRKGDPKEKIPSILPHPKYRVFSGDPKASLADRMRWIETSGQSGAMRAVVDSGADAPAAFDVSTASREQLVAFARDQYGEALDATGDTHLTKLRAQVRALAQTAGDLT
jgi:hypothetical protein